MNTQQVIEVLSQVNHVNYHGNYIEYVMGNGLDPTSYIFQVGLGNVKFLGSVQHGLSLGWVFNLKRAVENGDLIKMISH